MRPVDAMAAFGLVQLERLPKFAEDRKNNFADLFNFFSEFPYFNMPYSQYDPNWLAFPLTIKDAPFTRYELVKWFEDHDIQTRPIFSGNITRHKAFREFKGDFPNADYVMEHGILLGIHQGLDKTQLDYIKQTFNDFVTQF